MRTLPGTVSLRGMLIMQVVLIHVSTTHPEGTGILRVSVCILLYLPVVDYTFPLLILPCEITLK